MTKRTENTAANLKLQLKNKRNNFDMFSLALDDSDDCNTAQLFIFVCEMNYDSNRVIRSLG